MFKIMNLQFIKREKLQISEKQEQLVCCMFTLDDEQLPQSTITSFIKTIHYLIVY